MPQNCSAESKLQSMISLLAAYQMSPETYVREELGVQWWSKQAEVARALIKHKRVMVKASHSVGKTHLGGGLVNWFFDCFYPSITLTTAPTKEQVEDLLWKEVRVQRKGRPGLQPKAPRMETVDNHFAVGLTARDSNAFQGRHELNQLIIFDEAVGIDSQFWTGAEGMLTGDDHHWLCIFNPTDTASKAYEEEQAGNFHVITISALDHPNIAADLEGRPAPFPAAVRAGWVDERIRKWSDRIHKSDRKAADIEWPLGSGEWWRPGPLAESRLLGRWPSKGGKSVWSDALWEACLIQQQVPRLPLFIGCDVARYGDDFTSFVVRRGPCVLYHETHNGWSVVQTANRLKELAKEYAQLGEDPKRVNINVDDANAGGGVVDILAADDYAVSGINAGHEALEPEGYPNRRSELWFSVAGRADDGKLDLTRLNEESKGLIKRQFMAPTWKVDSRGRRVVEPKDDTKKRIGRSPDDADALNLAFAPSLWSPVAYDGPDNAPGMYSGGNWEF